MLLGKRPSTGTSAEEQPPKTTKDAPKKRRSTKTAQKPGAPAAADGEAVSLQQAKKG